MQDILEVAEGEKIEAVIIGETWDGTPINGVSDWREVSGKLLLWDEAIKYLNYSYDDGAIYTSMDKCQPIIAWTSNKVLFVVFHETSVEIISLPRNPVACIPTMIGGL